MSSRHTGPSRTCNSGLCNTNRISPGSPFLSVASFPSHWPACSGFAHKWDAEGLCLPRYVAHMSFSSRRRRGLGRRGCRSSHSAPLGGRNAKGIHILSREDPQEEYTPGPSAEFMLCLEFQEPLLGLDESPEHWRIPPPLLVLAMELYTLQLVISCYNESKECLEVVKTSADLLP